MIRKLVVLVIASLLVMSASYGAAKPASSLSGLNAGQWRVSFTPKNGIDLAYNGTNIIRMSDIVAYHGQYNHAYFNYLEGVNEISVTDIPNGKRVQIKHTSKTFKGTQTITLIENRAVFHLEYGMPKNVTDGLMDYCFGYISAQPFAGRAYSLKGDSGVRSGVISLKGSQEQEENYAPDYYKEATLESSIGKVHISLDGELKGLMFRDFRNSRYVIAGGAPVFWSGIWNVPLQAGRTYSETISLSIDPVKKSSAAVAAAPKTSAKVTNCRNVKVSPGGELRIIPEPKEVHSLPGYFEINNATRVVVSNDANEQDLSGAEQFSSEIDRVYGIKIKTIRERDVADNSKNMIILGEQGRNRLLDKAVSASGMDIPANEEGYALRIDPNRIMVAGHDRAGTFYGVQSLRQLVLPGKKSPRLHSCTVTDWPSLKFRGILLFAGKNAIPFHKKLIDRLLTKYKYNAVIIECDYMQWKTNPKMATPFAMSQEDLKKDIAYARKNFLEPIPLVQSLGHCEWAFKNGQNTDIAEDPTAKYAFCPSNPKSYDFLFSLFDEAIKLFDHPRYFHIGHDEVAMIGKFPACSICSSKTETELFLSNTNKIHDYLSKKGAKVMMWGDMLLGPNEAVDANNAHSLQEAATRRAGIPKDTIIADWHYAPASADRYPSLGVFKRDGFSTISATWSEPENISNFTLASKRQEIMGHLLTLWVGYDSNEDNVKHEKYQFDAIPLAGDYAWNSGDVPVESAPYKPKELFDNDFYGKKRSTVSQDGFTLDLRGMCNATFEYRDGETKWDAKYPGSLKSVSSEESSYAGQTFLTATTDNGKAVIRLASVSEENADFPSSVLIPANITARSLMFLHTAARFDDPGTRVGCYRIRYADGTKTDVPIVFGENIGAWNSGMILPKADIVWAQNNGVGEKVVARSMEWINTKPNTKIVSIEVIAESTEAGITLMGISGTK